MRQDDAELVAATLAGQPEAFNALAVRHHDALLGVVMRLLDDRPLAEEVVQEALTRAYAGLAGFRGESRFGTWLIQIGVHLARDQRRRARRRIVTVAIDGPGAAAEPAAPADAVSAGENPEERLTRREDEQLVLAALTCLPDRYREVLELKYYRGLSYAEIAALSGETTGTLKVRAHRARHMLKDILYGRCGLDPGGGRPSARRAP